MQTATTAPAASRIASGEGCDFWLIGGEVYRAPVGAGMDTLGMPLGKRWECSHAHWLTYRNGVYAWAADVPVASAPAN